MYLLFTCFVVKHFIFLSTQLSIIEMQKQNEKKTLIYLICYLKFSKMKKFRKLLHKFKKSCANLKIIESLTLRPRSWFIAADSFSVHSA